MKDKVTEINTIKEMDILNKAFSLMLEGVDLDKPPTTEELNNMLFEQLVSLNKK